MGSIANNSLGRKTPMKPGTRRGWNSTVAPSAKPIKTRTVSKRFARRRDPAYCEWVRRLPCVMQILCAGDVEVSHVRSRGAAGDDRGNVVPMCRRHHQQYHDWGRYTFEGRWRIDLKAEAQRLECCFVLRDFGGLSSPGAQP